MASAPGVAVEEGSLQECCVPSYKRKVMPPCSLDSPAGSSMLSLRKMQLDASPATVCDYSSNQLEDESDDEADQRPGSLSMVAIGERLATLQHLLPQGLELEEEEVLKVAIEYVKELERQIQMFHSTTEGCAKLEQSVSDSPLQRRGLCIVPLSALAKAL